jgi:hypothetical protein
MTCTYFFFFSFPISYPEKGALKSARTTLGCFGALDQMEGAWTLKKLFAFDVLPDRLNSDPLSSPTKKGLK